MRILDFSVLEALLSTKTYNSSYTPVPFNKIGSSLMEDLTRLGKIVELPEEEYDNLLVVKAQNGVFVKLLNFCIFDLPQEQNLEKFTFYQNIKDSKNGYIRFGKSYLYPVEQFKSLEGVEIEFEGSEKGTPTASVYLPANEEQEEDDLLIYFSLFFPSIDQEKLPKVIELKKAFKDGKLGTLLAPPPSGSLAVKINELEENTEHTIVSFQSFQTQFGTQFTLVRNDGQRIFTNTAVDRVLRANPVISNEFPAILSIGNKTTTRNGKIRVDAILKPTKFNNASDIDLQW